VLAGCAQSFRHIPIEQPAGPLSKQPQVRVPELGVRAGFSMLSLEPPFRLALTVEVNNDTVLPLTIEPGSATLVAGSLCRREREVTNAVATGLGRLPPKVDLKAAAGPITVLPGARSTFWIAFGEVDSFPSSTVLTLTLPRAPGAPLSVPVLDPTSCTGPERDERAGLIGFTGGFAHHGFGDSSEYSAIGLGAWYARGPWKGGLVFEGGSLFERSPIGWERASTFLGSLSLSWRVPVWGMGLYASGHAMHADFETVNFDDRWSPGFSVGLEAPFFAGLIPAATLRVGYTRLLDDRVAHPNGISFALDLRFFSF